MNNSARRHIYDRLRSAHHRTVVVLQDQTRHGFDPLEHLPTILSSPQYDFDVDLAGAAQDCAPQFPTCNTVEDTIMSRAAVSHLFGLQLLTEPPKQTRFEDAFVEAAHDFVFTTGQVGVHRLLSDNFDPSLTRLMAGFETYLPPTDLPNTVAPQISAHFARCAFTTMLEDYVPPQATH
jgi:hypothetical protein